MSEIATWEPQGICEASGFKYPLSQLVRQSGDVFPALPSRDAVEHMARDAEFPLHLAHSPTGPVGGADFNDGFISQFCARVRHTFTRIRPALATTLHVHVSRIVERRPRKKVFWVAANWVVARVADEQAIRAPMSNLEGNAVGVVTSATEGKAAITPLRAGAGPFPAPARLLHHAPPKGARDAAIPLSRSIRFKALRARSARYTYHVPLVAKATEKARISDG